MSRREIVNWRDIPRDERIRLIEQHSEPGESGTEIVAKLQALGIYGMTRNAIIGFMHRNMKKHGLSRGRGARKNVDPAGIKALPKYAPVLPPDPRNAKTMLELGMMDCRYPLWDGDFKLDSSLFCGCKTASPTKSWCGFHAARCDRPPPENRRQHAK